MEGQKSHTYLDVHIKPRPPTLTLSLSSLYVCVFVCVCVCLVGPCPAASVRLLSPLEGRGFEFLAVSVDARRAGVQLDEELGELVLREHRLQEALQEHVDEPTVHGLVLEHVEDPEDAFPRGVRSDDVLQLV